MSDKAYGPRYSEAALAHAVAGTSAADGRPEALRAAVRRAHDPALEVRDRSYNGGAVLDALRAQGNPALSAAAEWLEDAWALDGTGYVR